MKRNFPSRLKVHSADFLPEKRTRISTDFTFPSFSFVLEGCGDLRFRGCQSLLSAPFLLAEWPGDRFDYGPRPGESWAEFYIKYEPESFQPLVDCGFIDLENPVRPINDLSAVKSLIQELSKLANGQAVSTQADRADRLCEQIILNALLPERTEMANREEDVFREMQNFIHQGFDPNLTLDELARQFHMSPQTFRRRCYELHQMSPVRFFTCLRIEEGGRLLFETSLSVAEIARKVGFQDARYFSRRFHEEMGKTPTAFRKSGIPSNPQFFTPQSIQPPESNPAHIP